MRYLSQCPNCETVYQLSLMEMNISQGIVRCVHCQNIFNAYRHFIFDPERIEPPVSNFLTEILSSDRQLSTKSLNQQHNSQTQYVNQIMSDSIEGSKLNLYTYLNHLDTLNPIHSSPRPDKANPKNSHPPLDDSQATQHLHHQNKKKLYYYIAWGIINLLLVALLIFQILFFNSQS